MENTNTPQQNKFGNWLKTSITARMLMVGFLVIILLIPLAYINSLIKERSNRQESVIDEINEQWGDEVLIYKNQQHIEALAKAINTIPYELLTSISQRVKRVLKEC